MVATVGEHECCFCAMNAAQVTICCRCGKPHVAEDGLHWFEPQTGQWITDLTGIYTLREARKVPTHIRLDRDELLVLDWHLSGHYLCNVSRGLDIGEIIGIWHEFRADIWDGIRSLSDRKEPGIPLPPVVGQGVPRYDLPMDEGTAKYLFNWLPTTFMWGTGRDCGYTLKVKLHRFLRGEEENEDDSPNATEGNPKDTAGADS